MNYIRLCKYTCSFSTMKNRHFSLTFYRGSAKKIHRFCCEGSTECCTCLGLFCGHRWRRHVGRRSRVSELPFDGFFFVSELPFELPKGWYQMYQKKGNQKYKCYLPNVNIAPENWPSRKETNLPTIHLPVLC